MTLKELITPFPWTKYSKKLSQKILNPRSAGVYTAQDAEKRGMRFARGVEGSLEDGNYLELYWIVDPEDGIIADAKYQVFGQSALVGAAEGLCELIIGKNYDQAHRVSAELIDKHLRDKSDVPAFPSETYPHLNLVLSAVDYAYEECTDIPLADNYVAPPMPLNASDVVEGGYPGWLEMSVEKKMAVLEQVLDQDIRPYIALDAGGVELLRIEEGVHVIIKYQGACTSCMSSVGATLSYIQQMLRNKVSSEIHVRPEI